MSLRSRVIESTDGRTLQNYKGVSPLNKYIELQVLSLANGKAHEGNHLIFWYGRDPWYIFQIEWGNKTSSPKNMLNLNFNYN